MSVPLRYPAKPPVLYAGNHRTGGITWIDSQPESNRMRWPKATLTVTDRLRWQTGEVTHRDTSKELREVGVALNFQTHQNTLCGLGRQDTPNGGLRHEHLLMPLASNPSRRSRPASAPACVLNASERIGELMNGHSCAVRPVRYTTTSPFAKLPAQAAWETRERNIRAAFPCLTMRPDKSNFNDIQLARSKARWAERRALMAQRWGAKASL